MKKFFIPSHIPMMKSTAACQFSLTASSDVIQAQGITNKGFRYDFGIQKYG